METNYVNQKCDRIPKLRIEMLGKRGCSLYLDGRCMDIGIKKIEFIAEGSKNSPTLNLSFGIGDFRFCPERDLIEKPQQASAVAGNEFIEENK